MKCHICNGNFTKIYKLPLSFCDNCFIIFYRRNLILEKNKTEKFFDILRKNVNKYLTENSIEYSNINYLVNVGETKLEDTIDDTVFIVYSTDFLLNENFNRVNYVFNDYISCFYFNLNSIKLLTQKNNLQITHIKKYNEYIIFKVKKSETIDTSIINELIYGELTKCFYTDDIIKKFYTRFIYYRNTVQNKIIEKFNALDYLKYEVDKNNYTILFSIF